MPKAVTAVVLRCRRCERMVKLSEALVTNITQRLMTLRCPACMGVCDALELSNVKRGQHREGATAKQSSNRKARSQR